LLHELGASTEEHKPRGSKAIIAGEHPPVDGIAVFHFMLKGVSGYLMELSYFRSGRLWSKDGQ
jgi:hypothetical protein